MEFQVSPKFKEAFALSKSNILFFLANSSTYQDTVKDKVSYLDFARDNPNRISFLDSRKHERINNEGQDFYNPDKRIMSKPGRVFRKLFPNSSDAEIEKAVNLFKAHVGLCDDSNGYTFSLVKGSAIADYYLGDKYDYDSCESLGSLSDSCMRHEKCQDYFEVYTDNPHIINMLILVNQNTDLIIGRAIVWHTDHGVYMDRVYGSDVTQEKFFVYAAANGWNRKGRQSYEDPCDWVRPNGEFFEKVFSIPIDVSGYSLMPYLDTFKWSSDLTYLSNDECDDSYIFNDTEGGGIEERVTLYDGDSYNRDEAIYVERYSEYYRDHECVYSDYEGECIIQGDSIYSHTESSYLWDDRVVYLTDEETYAPEDADYVIEDGGQYFHVDNCIEVDGEMVFTDNAEYCEDEDCYVREGDGFYHEKSGKMYTCEEAAKEHNKTFKEKVVAALAQ